MIFKEWLTVTGDAWLSIWERFIAFLPNIIGAAIILVIGWLAGMFIETVVDRLFRLVGLQALFEKAKVEAVLKKASAEKDATALLASVAKWIIYLVAFIAASNTLQLTAVADFLNSILTYVPQVVVAVSIILIGLVLAHFLAAVVKGSIKSSGLGFADTASLIVRWSIIIFTVLAALAQLGIATYMINTLFVGLVAFLAIAGGLAFGLGGQKAASECIETIKKELK
ncbi:MAG: hypothetical protein WCP93_03145 [Candidatus Berkelbacteria bacterium]